MSDPQRRLSWAYDPRVDVLHLALGAPRLDVHEHGPHGLLLRRAAHDRQPCGVTVLDLGEWTGHRSELAGHVASFLGLGDDREPAEIVTAVFARTELADV